MAWRSTVCQSGHGSSSGPTPVNPQAAGHPLVADKLLNAMSGDPALFLHPYDCDFF